MQTLNWNDLRYLLAIARGHTLSGAATLMGVDDTTVSRRLSVLRTVLNDELCCRQPDGSLVLTDVGVAVASHIETMEGVTDLIGEVVGSDENECSGTVRVTSVPFLINRWLAPQTNSLLDIYPKLQIDLVPDSRDLNLNLREADIAIRLARPLVGGSRILGRRIGSLQFGIFAAQRFSTGEAKRLPWIGYDDTMMHLPQAQWISKATKRDGNEPAGLRVHDVETALEAVISGVGRSLLPIPIAEGVKSLRRLGGCKPQIEREVWLLTHRNQQSLRRIKVVANWIETLMKSSHFQ